MTTYEAKTVLLLFVTTAETKKGVLLIETFKTTFKLNFYGHLDQFRLAILIDKNDKCVFFWAQTDKDRQNGKV